MIPIHRWSERYPYWGKYFQQCVEQRGILGKSFLCVEPFSLPHYESILQEVDKGERVHFFIVQPAFLHRYESLNLPFPLSVDMMESWIDSASLVCVSHFFLGYHPWGGQGRAFELMGDRWWPTEAWLRGWTCVA